MLKTLQLLEVRFLLSLVDGKTQENTDTKSWGDGALLQEAGVEIVIVDNDRKAHSKTTRETFAKFGIQVWFHLVRRLLAIGN